MSPRFREAVRRALANPVLQQALDSNATRRRAGTRRAYEQLPDAEVIRHRARQIREALLQDWDGLLAQFTQNCEANGVHVLTAKSASEACEQVLRIARDHDVHLIAKAKSMVSEEIGLNPVLERNGLRVVETDLGEYIVQLRGEPPAHIITPAIHLRRQEVGRTFAEHLGIPYTDDVRDLTAAARRTLRQVFLTADMGISGVNLAAADSGTLCLVTNEGNGRMVTTLPGVHVALMGIERLVPTLEDVAVILQLLPRNATGQTLTSYVSLIQGPGKPESQDGPPHRYLILLDNGRRALQGTPLGEALLCIRCGACLNVCPVFQELGGHAYGSVYPGPIGSVISPGLFGLQQFGHLAKASTLCGACQEACPIGIDIPRMLLHLRQAYASIGGGRRDLRWGMRGFAWMATSPGRYAPGMRLARGLAWLAPKTSGWLSRLPPPGNAWTRARHFPPFGRSSFRERWHETRGLEGASTPGSPRISASEGNNGPVHPFPEPQIEVGERFVRALTAVSGEVIRAERGGIAGAILSALPEGAVRGVCAGEDGIDRAVLEELRESRVSLLSADGPEGLNHPALEAAQWGLVPARGALADSGSIILAGFPRGTLVASLLPPMLVVLLRQSDIYSDMACWIAARGRAEIAHNSMVVLVTGPSRTSDIEMTMTLGVHGPGQLVVILMLW